VEEVAVSEKHLKIINNKGKVIEYYVKQDSEDEKYLVREAENLNKFNYIKDVKFTLLNDKLVSIRLITDIETNKSTEFKITRLDFKLVREPEDDIEDDFYNFIKMNNVFLYSSNLSVSGSTSVNMSSTNEGTIMVDNWTKSDLIFGGNNNISMKNIYINKPSNKVSFNSSTKLGNLGVTEEVIIKGDVLLSNGGAEINGDYIFIDGNVKFTSSATIKGKEIYINGDVTFGNWSAKLIADKIYINGKVTFEQIGNVVGDLTYVNELPMPDQTKLNLPSMPSLHPDSWYYERGYVAGGALVNGSKIFVNNYSFAKSDSFNNVIIVSKSDITLDGWMHVTGLLFAPNGKVTFNGASFEGVVITKDGFYVTNGGSAITFRNVSDYISNIDDFPLR